MRKQITTALSSTILGVTCLIGLPSTALAVDGVILIDQSHVIAAGGFPYRIAQSGSYRLASDLTVSNANTTAIEISASGVTIDLNGFAIKGQTNCQYDPEDSVRPHCTNTGTGVGIIYTGGSGIGPNGFIAITNGTIQGMGSSGIELLTLGGGNISHIRAIGNGGNGIAAQGVISDCIADGNGNRGIVGINGSVVKHNVASWNVSDGFYVNGGGTVIGNVSRENGGLGLRLSSDTGYGQNSIQSVSGGVQIGGNACGRALCP